MSIGSVLELMCDPNEVGESAEAPADSEEATAPRAWYGGGGANIPGTPNLCDDGTEVSEYFGGVRHPAGAVRLLLPKLGRSTWPCLRLPSRLAFALIVKAYSLLPVMAQPVVVQPVELLSFEVSLALSRRIA